MKCFQMPQVVVILMLGCLAGLMTAEEKTEESATLETRLFQLPMDALAAREAVSEGYLKNPTQSLTEWEAFISGAKWRSIKEVLEAEGMKFPPGASVLYNPIGVLKLTNTPSQLELAEALLLSFYPDTWRKDIAFTAHLVQAPGSVLRSLSADASKPADQTKDLLDLLNQAGKEGSQVQVLHTGYVETVIGLRCLISSVMQHHYIGSLDQDGKGRVAAKSKMEPLGLQLHIEPLIGPERKYMDVTLSPCFSLLGMKSKEASSPPVIHKEETPVTLQMRDGETRLFGAWPAMGKDAERLKKEDLYQGIVLTLNETAARRDPHSAFPEMMIVKDAWAEHTFDLPEPFLIKNREVTNDVLLKVLDNNGLHLPSGSDARINKQDGKYRFVVKTTPEMLLVTERWLTGYAEVIPKTLQFKVEVIRAPVNLMHKEISAIAGKVDHSAMLASLHAAVKTGDAQFMTTVYKESDVGAYSLIETSTKQQVIQDLSWQKGQPLDWNSEFLPKGLLLQIDPSLDSSGQFIRMYYAVHYHPSSPVRRKELILDPLSNQKFDRSAFENHEVMVHSNNHLLKGKPRLIGVWTPVTHGGQADAEGMLEAAFITGHVVSHFPSLKAVSEEPSIKDKRDVSVTLDLLEVPAGVVKKLLIEKDSLTLLQSLLGDKSSGVIKLARFNGVTREEGAALTMGDAKSVKLLKGSSWENSQPKPLDEDLLVGTQLQIQSVTALDRGMVTLKYEFRHHPEMPKISVEELALGNALEEIPLASYRHSTLTGSISMVPGSGRMLGAWKHEGDAGDRLHIAFLTVQELPEKE